MTETADVVVVGLGAMGSAALLALARQGVRAVGIDRYHPPHDLGSTHGETRLWRAAVGEGGELVPFARRTRELWRAMGEEVGETLFEETGGLIIGQREGAPNLHGKPDFVRRSREVAAAHGVPHEMLSATELMRRFPQFAVAEEDSWALYEPGAGMALVERCVAAQLRLAEAAGARAVLDEAVLGVEEGADGVIVRTANRAIAAGSVVLAAGAWVTGLADAMVPLARVHRQTMHWFGVADPAAFAPRRFPVFIWTHGAAEADYLYTTTPDHDFILDRPEATPHVLVASPCSGHGFKHSAALGEVIAKHALRPGNPGPFGFARFKGGQP